MLFYDFEVFQEDWLVVINNPLTDEIIAIVNDRDQLQWFYDKHKNDVWIGYNSRHYDKFILKGILAGLNPYKISQHIIEKKEHGSSYSSLMRNIQVFDFDVKTTMNGLKQLEGFMGESIKETTVPFNIKRKLTDSEIQEVLEYCTHDVMQTRIVFENTSYEFESQVALLSAFGLPLEYISKTKAQLSAIVLGAVSHPFRGDEFDLQICDTIKLDKYKYIMDWYKNPVNLNRESKLNVDVANVPHTFAWGGLHGAIPKYKGTGIFVNVDVASYYPSLMIEYGFSSRNIKNPNKYKEIYEERLRLKALKDPKQAPYKIVLNSTYGSMNDKYNSLYDPRQAVNVCVNGQLMLLDLIEKLEPVAQIIQSNTDGVLIRINSMNDLDKVKSICSEWESRTRMVLEYDIFEKVFQKDVNNYIIVDKDGKYKSKGAYVKKLSKLDYDLPIVNKAIVQYLINNIPVEKTINECDSLIEFQKIVKVSNKYLYAKHGNIKLNEKVLRVFASRSLSDEGVFKIKYIPHSEGNVTNYRVEKIANTPDKCFIVNHDIKGEKVPRKLDKNYYIEIAKERIKDFIGG